MNSAAPRLPPADELREEGYGEFLYLFEEEKAGSGPKD